MKRNLILLLAVLMLVFAPTMLLRAEAATVVDSGTCGKNLTWVLDSDGLLTISGTGDMEDYDVYYWAPWDSWRASIRSVVVEKGVTSIGSFAFCSCSSLRSIAIPDGITTIGDGAFATCGSLSSITIPDGVTTIGDSAFVNCGILSSITIPGSVTSIGEYAFENCMSLRSVALPEGVTSIGGMVFAGCNSLSNITIPEGITSIGSYAFKDCESLKSITLPDSITSIGSFAFYKCTSLTSITIPESITNISHGSFWRCTNLISVTIPEGVVSIGSHAFWHCTNLCDITIPEGVISIEDNAFSNSGLNSIRLPDSVVSIGGDAFINCRSLRSITIPDSVATIGKGAFYHCDNLSIVHYAGTEAQKADILILESNAALVDATWHYGCSGANCIEQESPFGDVAADAYYFAPVLWAVNKGITNGLSEDSFGPDATCTRGQIVTFLWRACGSPEPKMVFNPFSDVSSEDYFYDAVLWAVENGITGGMGDGTFAPGAPCTRGQVATFLWRAEGQPYSYGENIFSDISYGAYYYDAVLWAVENGITNGMGEGIFAPDATCTRGQIVTFLYRAMN